MSMTSAKVDPPANDDIPLRLEKALEIAFPHGGMTVSGLRTEIRNGNLAIEVIAGKQFTTLNHIKEMRAKCRENQKGRGCTGASRAQADQDNGLSSTERLSAAQVAASKIAEKLRLSSKPT